MEEILRFGVFELLRLINLVPYFDDIFVDNVGDALEAVSSAVKVSQNEEELLGGRLTKELQVDFKDNFKKTVV